jgi:hypothetical protein
MHFLKCNNCGHLNEVKSEYLNFCSDCNKKLENNFSDWQKRNPEKNFEDFKQLICVSHTEMQSKSERKKSKGLKYWIGFSVTFAIFYAIGQFGGEAIGRFFKSEKTSVEVLDQKWIKETYGSFGLTVETPVKMTKGNLPVPDNVKQFVEKMDVYNYMSAKGFKVMINSIKYYPSVGQVNLQGAADGSVNEMKMQKGVTDFDYTEEFILKNDIPGFIQNGTFKQNGIGVEFINAGFSKGLILWQVMVIYQADDEVGRIASKRVIESIEINDGIIAL